jgi:hypothetical protein
MAADEFVDQSREHVGHREIPPLGRDLGMKHHL